MLCIVLQVHAGITLSSSLFTWNSHSSMCAHQGPQLCLCPSASGGHGHHLPGRHHEVLGQATQPRAAACGVLLGRGGAQSANAASERAATLHALVARTHTCKCVCVRVRVHMCSHAACACCVLAAQHLA